MDDLENIEAFNEEILVRNKVNLNMPKVTIRYKEGSKVIERHMQDVTDYFDNSEEIKAMSIKVGRYE